MPLPAFHSNDQTNVRRIRNPDEFASRFFPLLECHFLVAGVGLGLELILPAAGLIPAALLHPVDCDVPDVRFELHRPVRRRADSDRAQSVKDDEAARLHDEIRRVVMARDYVLQMHGFYLNEAEKTIQFDVVLDFEAPDEMALYADIVKDVQAVVPDYKLVITPDKDITD